LARSNKAAGKPLTGSGGVLAAVDNGSWKKWRLESRHSQWGPAAAPLASRNKAAGKPLTGSGGVLAAAADGSWKKWRLESRHSQWGPAAAPLASRNKAAGKPPLPVGGVSATFVIDHQGTIRAHSGTLAIDSIQFLSSTGKGSLLAATPDAVVHIRNSPVTVAAGGVFE
jgi:hypothetical protein